MRLIAFYLPQFHPTPENDAWWGKGFTEWRNVVRAAPNFPGHYQPHLPGELGFYDLRVPETRAEQAALARSHGVHAFCYYHYWFSGRHLLRRPLDDVLASGAPDFPFCICWANESWTRRWDGLDQNVLIEQQYRDEDALGFIRDALPVLLDRRYVRVNGRPLLLVYNAAALPDPRRWTAVWREEAQRAGLPGLYLSLVHSVHQTEQDPRPSGFDAAVEFPPHLLQIQNVTGAIAGVRAGFRGRVLDYIATARYALSRTQPGYTLFRGVMPSWDNTARGQDTANCFVNAEPANYERWLRGAVDVTRRWHAGEERIVFVNAWNEWAEGCHLEPDLRYGRAFLEATARAISPTH
ncbi:MAG: glycoside hydrolase family 99-like domain-containing protein [Pseudomonadota bacterium]|nr:glycoside hydrolase family 99-like domain-containing protein [Pseudomonadota bacterium]